MQAILPNKRSIRGLFCSEVRSRAHFHLGFPIWCLEGSKSRAFIGGRRINLHCTGAGGPTVILMAGLFSWSVVWYKTQPVIAQKTRVCAFDRAGYGFSDPGPRPGLPTLPSGLAETGRDFRCSHCAIRLCQARPRTELRQDIHRWRVSRGRSCFGTRAKA